MTTVDAVAVLRGLIAQTALKMPAERYLGYDWYQLADQEADVFDIVDPQKPMSFFSQPQWQRSVQAPIIPSGCRWGARHPLFL